jgi:hypothetical protein
LERGKDGPIWEHARNDNAVIITKDEDFADRWLLSDQPVPLIWIRKGAGKCVHDKATRKKLNGKNEKQLRVDVLWRDRNQYRNRRRKEFRFHSSTP